MNSFMQKAIEQAKLSDNEIPVGAIIVKNGKIISSARNLRETKNDVTAHAEILAIKKAEEILGNWRLEECDMYVTLEPCPMCGWAIMQSRIKNLYFGSYDNKYGAFSSSANIKQLSDFCPNIYGGILEKECDKIITDFFKSIRKK